MPCYDHRDSASYVNETEVISLKLEVEELKKRCNFFTDLLCKAGKSFYNSSEPPQDLLDWWKHHEEWDRKRGEPWDE